MYRNLDDNTWTETQPNGLQLHYRSDGKLNTVESRAGDVWTLAYDGENRPVCVTDPFGGRTTLAYDASSYLRRVQDSAGRITT